MATAALPVPAGGYGTLRVVPPGALDRMEQQFYAQKAAAEAAPAPDLNSLAGYIRSQFEMMRNHRNNQAAGWSHRLVGALQTFNGVYDSAKLAEIMKFGGSTAFMRVTAMRCRGASSLLRDVYLSPDRPWGLDPASDPDVPEEVIQSIRQLVSVEAQTLAQAGQPIDVDAVRDRVNHLMMAARRASKERATDQARISEEKLDEILTEGGFYKALQEFLVDLPIFPFACIKGPTVRIVPTVMWNGGKATLDNKPRLFWQRVSPFDIWFTPGVADIEDAAVIERQRLTRADLNDLLDLPGYNQKEIEAVLEEYGTGGLVDNWDATDAERATMENRENPMLNRSGLITCLEFQGNVQGKMLLNYGMPSDQVPDPIRDYSVQAWLIGSHVIKVQHTPSPRKRHNYYITSWEKVPGTPVGNGLTDTLADIQSVVNSTARSLINNMSIASGPQVVINADRLNGDENMEDLFPWKRWFFSSDPMANNSQVPISFFQPNSNAQELLTVYKFFTDQADELSGIPKYMSGAGAPGGAGRTA
ncbi:MAG: portal protein, partial [Burkholderiales bacterium]